MSFENDPSSENPMSESVCEITKATLDDMGEHIIDALPSHLRPTLESLVMRAVDEGIAFGEAIASLPDDDDSPGGLEHYTRGYIDAIEDTSMKKEQGE